MARRWLTDEERLYTAVAVHPDDLQGGRRFHPADVVACRDLLYAATLPSDNAAPNAIALGVGRMALDHEDRTGDPIARFVRAMNEFAAEFDLKGLFADESVEAGPRDRGVAVSG
ncbi:hypothetical protein BCY76_013220 [Nesterenkonia sp. PF2B19]|nr:hypothetical protein BCY76_013220 [Nesterenkonia sp. PF2B19]